MFYFVLRKSFSWLVKLIWVKEVKGIEYIPKKGRLIIAANHSSYLDFICLIAVLNRPIYFLVAEKFYHNIFWWPLVRFTNQIKVERQAKDKLDVIKMASQILKKERILGIFPEGTRSRDGKIHKAYSGVVKLARLNQSPIVPVGINRAFDLWPPQKKVPNFKKKVKINFGQSILPGEYSALNAKEAVEKIVIRKIKKLLN